MGSPGQAIELPVELATSIVLCHEQTRRVSRYIPGRLRSFEVQVLKASTWPYCIYTLHARDYLLLELGVPITAAANMNLNDTSFAAMQT